MLLKKDGPVKEYKPQRCPRCKDHPTLHPENTEFGVRLVCSCGNREDVKK